MCGSSRTRASASILAWGIAGLASPAPARSIAVVTIDTLRVDRVGAHGHPGMLTPGLDRQSRRSVLYREARTVAPLTLPAHASLFTGLGPAEHGIRNNGFFRLKAGIRTMAEELSARGHATAAFVSSDVLHGSYGLARGFDVYDDLSVTHTASVQLRNAERPDGETMDRALAWLARRGGPADFMLWVHLFGPHAPHDPGEPFAVHGTYDGEVASADHQASRLLRALRDRPADVWVASDHGESLGDHGEPTHGIFVYDQTARVILMGATGRRAAISPDVVSLADAHATILDRPRRAGPALLECLAPRLDFAWSGLHAVVDGDLKYISAPVEELYDLGLDPGETRNLASARAKDVARLRRLLPEAPDPTPAGQPDAEARRRLESLGYLGGSDSGRSAARARGADPKAMVDLLPFLNDDPAHLQENIEAFLQRDPGNPLVRLRKAWLVLSRGSRREAAAIFSALAREEVLGSAPWQGLAACASAGGDFETALRHFEEAARRDPGDLTIAFNAGQLELHLGRPAAAVPLLVRGLGEPAVAAKAAALLFRIERSGAPTPGWSSTAARDASHLEAMAEEAERSGDAAAAEALRRRASPHAAD